MEAKDIIANVVCWGGLAALAAPLVYIAARGNIDSFVAWREKKARDRHNIKIINDFLERPGKK